MNSIQLLSALIINFSFTENKNSTVVDAITILIIVLIVATCIANH